MARYYSSAQGRFTSADPENAGASHLNPQSWNGYSYSLNNPLRFIDPDGLRWAQYQQDGATVYKWFDDTEKDANGQTEYDRAIAAGYSKVTFDESKPYSFTNGLFAPGEKQTVVELLPDGTTRTSTYTLSWSDYQIELAYKALTGDNYDPGRFALEFLASRIGQIDSGPNINLPSVPAAAGIKLTPAEQRKLGNLANRAEEKVADVIRSRGGTGANVNKVGEWAEKTLAETAKAAVQGNKNAETAIKIVKQAGRLGQKH